MNSLRKVAFAHASLFNHLGLERPLVDRQTHRERRCAALAEWQGFVG